MIVRDLLLVGGGHSHLFVLRSFGMRPIGGLRLTLISDDSYAAYSGMLPGLIAGHYEFDDAHIDLRNLAGFANARFVRAKVVGFDPNDRLIHLDDRPPLSYDLCSINTGGLPAMPPDAAQADLTVAVKPVPRLLTWLRGLERQACGNSRSAKLAVIGAGAGGVELALALAQRFQGQAGISVSLVEQASEILPGFPRAARQAMRRALRSASVAVHTDATPQASGSSIRIGLDDEEVRFDHAIFATGVNPAPWLADCDLARDPKGFVAVDRNLRSLSHPTVFAAGDVASQSGSERPKAGVFAVRQGPILAQNLRRLVLGEALASYRPQSRYLTLLAQGPRRATAVRNGLALSGDWVWAWKDRIDRRFMRRFTDLPVMTKDPRSGRAGKAMRSIEPEVGLWTTVRCAGCGAKVPGDTLNAALGRLRSRSGAEFVIDQARRDDAYVARPPSGHEIVQSLDFFPALVSDPFVFGQIAAAHALSDLYAMGAAPMFALANVVLPFASEGIQEEELFQVLSGALDVLEEDGATLAGGHSSEGETLGLGFAVTGHLPAGTSVSKRGLRAGNVLILTKPIGTGALFAAAMRRLAKAHWIDAAVRAMRRSNRVPADIFRRHGVTAMSDVTGFGLGGHLAEMLAGGGLAAEIDVAAIPVLEGFNELLDTGIESTLAGANLRLLQDAMDYGASDPHALRLLTDPQTSGGLLAGIPAENATACIAALQASGHPEAAIIGGVSRRTPEERAISLTGT